jgi:mRNA-degrading endonuclease RelE of RelBE toxin-antitoxin system
MRLVFSKRFDRSLRDAPPAVQRAFWKQSELLLLNPRHPSLCAKKYEGADTLWQARVTHDWRFYFTIDRGMYNLIDITAHPK